MVWQNIMCTYFGYTRFSVWATNDNFGTKATMESGDGTYCDLHPLTLHSVRFDTEDFTDELNIAIAGGSRIHIFFVPAATAARIIEQGYEKGLFVEGTQIFGAYTLLSPELFTSFKDPTKIDKYLKGAMVLRYAPNYNLRNPTGKEFLNKFRALPDTISVAANGKTVCHQDSDDSGTVFLYRDALNVSKCSGITPSKYDRFTMYPNTPHAYDAAYALAYGFHMMVEDLKVDTLDSELLHELLMLNVSFEGATGYVKFYEGMSGFNDYAEGDREEGHTYLVYNFNDAMFDNYGKRKLDNSNATQYAEDGWSLAYLWTVEDGIVLCDKTLDPNCKPAVYNTHDGKPALDRKLPLNLILSDGLKGFLIALGVITLLLSLSAGSLITFYRSSKFIMAAQPPMLVFIVFGSIICGIRIILDGITPSNEVCVAKFWLGHLCFSFIFGAIFLKTYRLHKIVNNKSLKRVVFSNTKITRYMLIGLGIQLVYLAITTGVAEPRLVYAVAHVSNQDIISMDCGFRAGGLAHMNTALYACEALFLIWGMNFTFAVRDVPDAVNETAYIVQVVSIMLIILCFVFPLVFLLNLPATTQQLISSLGFFISGLVELVVLFGSKAYLIRKDMMKKAAEAAESGGGAGGLGGGGGGDNKKSKGGKYSALEPEMKKNVNNPQGGDGANAGAGASVTMGSGGIVYSDALFKHKDYAFKVTTARDQIAMWRLILMKLEDNSSGGTGSGTNTGPSDVSAKASSANKQNSYRSHQSQHETLHENDGVEGGVEGGGMDDNALDKSEHMDSQIKVKPKPEPNGGGSYTADVTVTSGSEGV